MVQNSSVSQVWYDAALHVEQEVSSSPKPAAVLFFRAVAKSMYGAQTAVTIEPGMGVEIPRLLTGVVELRLDPPEQAAWQSVTLMTRAAEGYAQRQENKDKSQVQADLIALFSGRSKTRAAVLTCAQQGFQFGERMSQIQDESQLSLDLLKDLKGAAQNLGSCANALREAENERAAARVPAGVLTDAEVLRTWEPESQGVLSLARRGLALVGKVR